jgi:predicted  nucleic acid-binding Zn-ribbon protein
MQTITTQTSGIHCKVATQTNEVRRFLLLDKNYAALLEQICQLFGFSKDNVVIKYADEEGDFVTISSDEEVQFAIVEVAKNCVLKLLVEQRQPSAVQGKLRSSVVSDPAKNRENFECEGPEESSSESDGSAKTWCAEKKRGKRLFHMQKKKEHLLAHIVELEAQAAQTGQDGAKSQQKIEKMKNRVAHLSGLIDRFEHQPQEPFHPPSFDPSCRRSSPANLPQEPSVHPSCPSPPLLSKDEVIRQLDEISNEITGIRLALRQACLQIQLQRANLQAASRQRDNSGENAITVAGPNVSEEQIQQMKDAIGQAKERKAAKKAELKSLTDRAWALRRQLHHEEKAHYKQGKCAEKYHRKQGKCAEKHDRKCRRH